MSLRNIVLSLAFAIGCGGSTTGSNGNNDGSLDCKVNCMLDGGNNKDGFSNDSCCNYSDGGKLDAGNYDGMGDGSGDATVNDGNNCNVDNPPTSFPYAKLTCNEWAEDCLCIFRPIKEQDYCWDASGSQAGSGRTLVEYRIYFDFELSPDGYIYRSLPSVCLFYNVAGEFHSKLRVIDNLGDFDDQEFYNIVTED